MANPVANRMGGPDTPSDTITALTDFLGRFAPAVGERHDGLYLADDSAADGVLDAVLYARNDAMAEAFRAVSRLARAVATEPTPTPTPTTRETRRT